MSGSVSAAQRFTKRHPCPICGGHNQLPSGRGVRCYGNLGSDECYAHCSREVHDRVDALERLAHLGRVTHVAPNQLDFRSEIRGMLRALSMHLRRETVQCSHLVALGKQGIRHIGAEKPGTACD